VSPWLSDIPDLPAQVDAGLLLLRVLVGVTFSLHGFQKLFGWFGGGGFEGTSRWFASLGFGDGRVATAMAGGTEVSAGLGLAAGVLTPVAAAGMIGVMTVAGAANRQEGGFWSASKGWELNGYLVVVAWAVATTGPGAYSLDALLGAPVPSGVLPGLLALVAGVGLGWLRWATRTTD
jgi:putative oxidoreductase